MIATAALMQDDDGAEDLRARFDRNCEVKPVRAATALSSGGGEAAAAIVLDRLLDLFSSIHDEWTVLHDGLTQRAARQQQEAHTLRSRLDANGVSGSQHACG